MTTSCARYSRLVRGGLGTVAGGIVGAAAGFGGAYLSSDKTITRDNFSGLTMLYYAAVLGLVGAVTGATIGAWKPQC